MKGYLLTKCYHIHRTQSWFFKFKTKCYSWCPLYLNYKNNMKRYPLWFTKNKKKTHKKSAVSMLLLYFIWFIHHFIYNTHKNDYLFSNILIGYFSGNIFTTWLHSKWIFKVLIMVTCLNGLQQPAYRALLLFNLYTLCFEVWNVTNN